MQWHQLKSLIKSHKDFLIFTHKDPDGDAIGSSAALAYLLQKLGKRVRVILEHPLDLAFIQILDPELVYVYQTPFCPPSIHLDSVVVFWLDCQHSFRLGKCQELFLPVSLGGHPALHKSVLCIIDHHTKTMSSIAKSYTYIEPHASSCGVLIYQVYKHLNIDLDLAAAKALYWALASDTLQFSLQSTSSIDLEVAAECLKKGVKPSLLHNTLNEIHLFNS